MMNNIDKEYSIKPRCVASPLSPRRSPRGENVCICFLDEIC